MYAMMQGGTLVIYICYNLLSVGRVSLRGSLCIHTLSSSKRGRTLDLFWW